MKCCTSGTKLKRPHRRMMLLDVTDENYQTMLLKHKRRKLEDPVSCFCVGASLRIGLLHFQARCHKTRLNLALDLLRSFCGAAYFVVDACLL